MSEKSIYHRINLEELYECLQRKPDVIHSEIVKNNEVIGLLVLYFNGVIHLVNIVINEEYQGRGYASEILRIITNYSDDQKIVIQIMARMRDCQ